MKISLIVSTYNREDALRLVLNSIKSQKDDYFEVIVADDGSDARTRAVVQSFIDLSGIPVTHVWQEDLGFRLAAIRNRAIEKSSGDYLVFLDGDCVLQPDFVSRHRSLATPNHLVTGGRILLGKETSRELIESNNWDYPSFKKRLISYRLRGQVNRLLPAYLKFGDSSLRNYSTFVWRRIKGCNLACWKKDALVIDGFDESITGWGHEDADFVFRLHVKGVVRKSGSWATEVFHLYHPEPNKLKARENENLVRQRIMSSLRAR